MVPLRRPAARRWHNGGLIDSRVGRKLGQTGQKPELLLRRRVAMARPRLPRLLRPATAIAIAVMPKAVRVVPLTALAASKRYHSR